MRLLALQVPFALAAGAVFFAFMAAYSPTYWSFPWQVPYGWQNPFLLIAFIAYPALALAAIVASCAARTIRPLIGRSSPERERVMTHASALEAPPESVRRHAVAAALLAALVLASAVPHLGEGSGFWRTSRPVRETDVATADGYPFWLEGRPLQSDSGHFVLGYEALFAGAPLESDPLGWLRAGRVAYIFLAGLLAGATGLAGTLYGAFVGVSVILWWGASLALYDLTRAAHRSWWAGVTAGALAATGLGFTFMVGAAMSPVSGYAAAALVPWTIWRLGALRSGARLRDDLLSASLAGAAGLLNSLTPTFLLFAVLWRGGRADLRRLALWAATALAITALCGRILDLAVLPSAGLREVVHALAPATIVAPVLALQLAPRGAVEWLLGAGVTALSLGVIAVLSIAPGVATALYALLHEHLQLPEYVVGQAGQRWSFLATLDIWSAAYHFRAGGFGEHFTAAFPTVLCPLVLIGLARTRVSWVRWALAIVVAAAATTVGMNTLTGVPHPRLMYLAYPGMYVLAAGGLHAIWSSILALRRPAHSASLRFRQGLALAVVAGLLCLALLPSFAGRLGWESFDFRFHYLEVP